MPDNAITTTVAQSLDQAIGGPPDDGDLYGRGGLVSWLVYTGDLIPPWWSPARDRSLYSFMMECNHLSTAVYNATAKIAGIPFEIVPRDISNARHREEAEQLNTIYNLSAGFGRGWQVEYTKYLTDLLVTDNGGFMEIIGDGPPDGPIVGRVISMRQLDSARCVRTAHPVFPVLYTDDDGKMYKLHYTRVLYSSQMPSARKEMNGVGLSAVSRSVMVAQNLLDIYTYKMQRLGSRPHNQLLIGKGITGQEIMLALRRVEEEMTSRGFTRYARTVALGSKNTEVDITKVDLAHMDPFDESASITLGMFAIAAAIGMDADELWPVSGRSGGGSSGDANLRRMRSRGRLPAQATMELKNQFEYKIIPPHLTVRFDFHDDEEDQQKALIRDIRGRNRERDLMSGSTDVRTVRIQMLDDGDVASDQFEIMELNDGRLPNGDPIAILFFSQDPIYKRHLNYGSLNPIDIHSNDAMSMLTDISNRKRNLLTEWSQTISSRKDERLNRAWHALDWLDDQYKVAAGLALPFIPQAHRRLRVDRRVDEPIGVTAEEENV